MSGFHLFFSFSTVPFLLNTSDAHTPHLTTVISMLYVRTPNLRVFGGTSAQSVELDGTIHLHRILPQLEVCNRSRPHNIA